MIVTQDIQSKRLNIRLRKYLINFESFHWFFIPIKKTNKMLFKLNL